MDFLSFYVLLFILVSIGMDISVYSAPLKNVKRALVNGTLNNIMNIPQRQLTCNDLISVNQNSPEVNLIRVRGLSTSNVSVPLKLVDVPQAPLGKGLPVNTISYAITGISKANVSGACAFTVKFSKNGQPVDPILNMNAPGNCRATNGSVKLNAPMNTDQPGNLDITIVPVNAPDSDCAYAAHFVFEGPPTFNNNSQPSPVNPQPKGDFVDIATGTLLVDNKKVQRAPLTNIVKDLNTFPLDCVNVVNTARNPDMPVFNYAIGLGRSKFAKIESSILANITADKLRAFAGLFPDSDKLSLEMQVTATVVPARANSSKVCPSFTLAASMGEKRIDDRKLFPENSTRTCHILGSRLFFPGTCMPNYGNYNGGSGGSVPGFNPNQPLPVNGIPNVSSTTSSPAIPQDATIMINPVSPQKVKAGLMFYQIVGSQTDSYTIDPTDTSSQYTSNTIENTGYSSIYSTSAPSITTLSSIASVSTTASAGSYSESIVTVSTTASAGSYSESIVTVSTTASAGSYSESIVTGTTTTPTPAYSASSASKSDSMKSSISTFYPSSTKVSHHTTKPKETHYSTYLKPTHYPTESFKSMGILPSPKPEPNGTIYPPKPQDIQACPPFISVMPVYAVSSVNNNVTTFSPPVPPANVNNTNFSPQSSGILQPISVNGTTLYPQPIYIQPNGSTTPQQPIPINGTMPNYQPIYPPINGSDPTKQPIPVPMNGTMPYPQPVYMPLPGQPTNGTVFENNTVYTNLPAIYYEQKQSFPFSFHNATDPLIIEAVPDAEDSECAYFIVINVMYSPRAIPMVAPGGTDKGETNFGPLANGTTTNVTETNAVDINGTQVNGSGVSNTTNIFKSNAKSANLSWLAFMILLLVAGLPVLL